MSVSTFSQPGWTPESGLPYPGAESAAEAITADQQQVQIAAQAEVEKMRILARRQAERAAEDASDPSRRIKLTKASSVPRLRTKWLWASDELRAGRIPLGELTLIVGRGGVGKSTLLCELAAWITRGTMGGEYFGQPKNVLYVANEDSLERTVGPRLVAADADLDRVFYLKMEELGEDRSVILPTDCQRILETAQDLDVAAIMLDPLSSNLRVENGNDPRKVRPVLEAVRRMCEIGGFAALGLAHTRKQSSSDLMQAILGSSELGNVCRSAMGVMLNEDEEPPTVVLSQEKLNVGSVNVPSYEYRINTEIFVDAGETISTGKIEWLGRTDMRVSDMLMDKMVSPGASRDAISDAIEFIRDYLIPKGGQAPRAEIIRAAQNEGMSRATIDRAAKRMKLTKINSGAGASKLWCLPPGA